MSIVFRWSNEYSVQSPEIDAQHQRLFELINQLYEALSKGEGKQVMGKALKEMADYTRTHFATEERLMLACQYPNFSQHKAEHDEFIQKVADFQVQFHEGRLGLTVQVANFLKDWLKGHILGSDQKYVPYLPSRRG